MRFTKKGICPNLAVIVTVRKKRRKRTIAPLHAFLYVGAASNTMYTQSSTPAETMRRVSMQLEDAPEDQRDPINATS